MSYGLITELTLEGEWNRLWLSVNFKYKNCSSIWNVLRPTSGKTALIRVGGKFGNKLYIAKQLIR